MKSNKQSKCQKEVKALLTLLISMNKFRRFPTSPNTQILGVKIFVMMKVNWLSLSSSSGGRSVWLPKVFALPKVLVKLTSSAPLDSWATVVWLRTHSNSASDSIVPCLVLHVLHEVTGTSDNTSRVSQNHLLSISWIRRVKRVGRMKQVGAVFSTTSLLQLR